jgi:TRAP-type C4-dicarboxylate transport system substrate-binding protein
MSAPTSRIPLNRRTLLRAGGHRRHSRHRPRPGLRANPAEKLVFAHINAIPESAAVAFDWMAKEVTAQSKGALDMQFFGKTLTGAGDHERGQSGSIAMGSPAARPPPCFRKWALLVPYLVKDYASAYASANGRIGDKINKEIEDKYKLKVLCYFDYGFRHF